MTLSAKQLDMIFHLIATGSAAAKFFGMEDTQLDAQIQQWMVTGERNEALEVALEPKIQQLLEVAQDIIATIKRIGVKA